MLISSIAAALTGLIIYIYFFRNGQFEDSETVKYQMFHEDEEET